MPLEFRPFRAGHLRYVTPQAAQKDELEAIRVAGLAEMLEGPYALSGWRDGRCIGAAGLQQVFAHRAACWMLLSEEAEDHMVAITRKVRRVVALSPYRRVELTVDTGFPNGHKFAELLGFKRETDEPLQAYGPAGNAEHMYALIKE